MQLTDLITAKEATDMLGVSRTTLSKFVSSGSVTVALTLSNGQELFDRNEIERVALERAA